MRAPGEPIPGASGPGRAEEGGDPAGHRSYPAIYKLEGDTLTVCYAFDAAERRPQVFTTKGSQTKLVVLVRLPKAQAPADPLLPQNKQGAAATESLTGLVKAVDGAKNTITVAQATGKDTYAVAGDATIVINGRPGNLAGVRPGARVTLGLGADRKTADKLDVLGPKYHHGAAEVYIDNAVLEEEQVEEKDEILRQGEEAQRRCSLQ